MALKYPDRLESNNPSSYGIVKSIEVAGHKTVNTKQDLLNLADAILSDSKTNSNNDAIGQQWYVYSENCFYQLIDWTNRKSENGWRKVITDISLNNNLESHKSNTNNPHQVTKSQIGLNNVTNDTQVKRSEMGANNGVATLDSSGKIVTSQLPSFVDDVLEFESKTAFPATGESGKIYVSLDTNLTYRWGGTEYVEISKSLALGETSSTAYAGDKGKDTTDKLNTHLENYNNPHQVTKAQIGLGNVDNTSDLEKPISNAVQTALDEKLSELYLGYRYYPINNSNNVINFRLDYLTLSHFIIIQDPNYEDIASCELPVATVNVDGLFSKTDKSKLDNIESGAQVNTITGIKGSNESVYRIGNVNITKANIGLGNVNNTSDLDKPISTATQTALDKKVNKSTTLAGYGITDAKINNNGTITLGTVSIEVMTNNEINAMFV